MILGCTTSSSPSGPHGGAVARVALSHVHVAGQLDLLGRAVFVAVDHRVLHGFDAAGGLVGKPEAVGDVLGGAGRKRTDLAVVGRGLDLKGEARRVGGELRVDFDVGDLARTAVLDGQHHRHAVAGVARGG